MEQLKILVAEDEETTRLLFGIAFKGMENVELRFAANGEEALTSLKAWHPDILLLDIRMPEMNGFEVLQVLRQVLNDKKTTVIMVSSVGEKNEIVVCAKLGIQGYILKPFVTKTLAATVLGYHKKARQQA